MKSQFLEAGQIKSNVPFHLRLPENFCIDDPLESLILYPSDIFIHPAEGLQ